MLVVRGTKKLRDRLKSGPRQQDEKSTARLGDWYATALFWRPQLALFVNESSLLPVLVPLAPAGTVIARFPPALGAVLHALDASPVFMKAELAPDRPVRFATDPDQGGHPSERAAARSSARFRG